MVKKNTGWTRATFDRLPHKELYIFDAILPGPLEDDKRFLGSYLETERRYTFKMAAMEPTLTAPGGTARIVDSTNFPVSTGIAAAMVTIKPEQCARCIGTPMPANGNIGSRARDE